MKWKSLSATGLPAGNQRVLWPEILQDFPDVSYVIVNESGASVYSASELARHEFPDLTVEKRSAISIARRLQDPWQSWSKSI